MREALVLILILLLQGSHLSVPGQTNRTTFFNITPNTYAPNLYSEKINLQISLVDLPGSHQKGSVFQGSYKIYFTPEGEIEKLAQNRGGIDQMKGDDILTKILVAEGTFNKTLLAADRIFERRNIDFKSRVPDKQRTISGKLVIFYSIKVYDAKLKKSIYKDSIFIYFPFERSDTSKARDTFHLSFLVTENGQMFTSSLPRERSSTKW
jgi:hypothetical protein